MYFCFNIPLSQGKWEGRRWRGSACFGSWQFLLGKRNWCFYDQWQIKFTNCSTLIYALEDGKMCNLCFLLDNVAIVVIVSFDFATWIFLLLLSNVLINRIFSGLISVAIEMLFKPLPFWYFRVVREFIPFSMFIKTLSLPKKMYKRYNNATKV